MPRARCTSSSTSSTLAGIGLHRRLFALVDDARQRDGERRAAVPARALGLDRAAMALRHRAHDEQAEAGARVTAADLRADAIEPVEDQPQVVPAHADALVLHAQRSLAVAALRQLDLHADG